MTSFKVNILEYLVSVFDLQIVLNFTGSWIYLFYFNADYLVDYRRMSQNVFVCAYRNKPKHFQIEVN